MNWGPMRRGPMRWGTNESGGPVRWGTNEMSGAWVLMDWGINEMGDQWDGGPMSWGANEMGDQWDGGPMMCTILSLTSITFYCIYFNWFKQLYRVAEYLTFYLWSKLFKINSSNVILRWQKYDYFFLFFCGWCRPICFWPALCAGLLCCNFFYMLTPVPFYHFFSSLILLFIHV